MALPPNQVPLAIRMASTGPGTSVAVTGRGYVFSPSGSRAPNWRVTISTRSFSSVTFMSAATGAAAFVPYRSV
ncbi:MAG: hypothetical protein BWY76_02913 [bacterium ADurb.Bin429]|nr:MAG: hypothetical protein BWY76_02913 [bacterium ADurb.Bin429]